MFDDYYLINIYDNVGNVIIGSETGDGTLTDAVTTHTGASSNLRRSPVEVLLVEEGNSTAASNRPNYGGAAT